VKQSVVVVGAGIIGCAIARQLAVRGTPCTVLDPRRVAGGATRASAGMLAPYVEAHAGGPLLDLGVRSLDLYDGWIAALRAEGCEIEYRRLPTLEIALTPQQATILRTGHAEWLPPAVVAAAVRQLGPTAGGLRDDRHGYVDAPQLADALATSASRHGATFVPARVERIDRQGSALRIQTGPGDDDFLDATTVVLAAGAWTNRIHGVVTPPLRPIRGQLLRVTYAEGVLPFILWGPDCYVVPRQQPPGVLIGATVEDVGFDERTTVEGVKALLAAARRLLPNLRDDMLMEARAGLRPVTPDALPVLGPDRDVPGLIHASGHYRNGVLLAPITAQIVADLIVDGRRDTCLESFRPERFANS
jgi:glycine oxidase